MAAFNTNHETTVKKNYIVNTEKSPVYIQTEIAQIISIWTDRSEQTV